MEIHYQEFEEEKLLVIKYVGNFSIQKYIDIISNYNYELKFEKILTDLRETNIEDVLSGLKKMKEVNRDIEDKTFFHVYLVDTPKNTAIVDIYINSKTSKNKEYRYCSTLNYALNLLELDMSENEIAYILSNLKNKIS